VSLLSRFGSRWRKAPVLIFALAILLLAGGLVLIVQNEASYRFGKAREVQVQAEILAASVAAALDFSDAPAAQESVNAFQVNRQIEAIGVFDGDGRPVAFHGATGVSAPASLAKLPEVGSGTVRSLAPVISGGHQIGTVYLDVDREPVSRRLTRYGLIAFLTIFAALVFASLGLAQVALSRANRKLVAANAELKVQMDERAKAEEQLRQSQKMQALGQLTGGIAHDFNNLLTVIQGSADMLCRPGVAEEKRERYAKAIVQAAENAAALTSQLLAFARRQPLKPERIDVNLLIGGMRDLLDRTLGERVTVRSQLDLDGCPVEVDRAQLESAILNIAVNARDAMPEGGSLIIRTAAVTTAETRYAEISFTDTGFGMDEETLTRVFEPFFTTKETGRGTGLGLSQVYGFASQSGGEVRADSTPGVGTTITLLLPCAAAGVAEGSQSEAPQITDQEPARVLVVEDNEEVAAFAVGLLEELGHRTVVAHSARAGLDRLRNGQFDLVFTDIVMPGMTGIELAELVERDFPELPVLLTTGFSRDLTSSGISGRAVLLKPYKLDSLARAVEAALRSRMHQNSL